MPVLQVPAMTAKAAPTRVHALWTALRALPPRDARRLQLRLVEGRSDAECAQLYGSSLSAFGVHLLRAARLFQQALQRGGPGPLLPSAAPVDPEVERAEGARLLARLGAGASGESAPGEDELGLLLPLLRELGARGAELRALDQAQVRAELESPAHRRREWLRRIALAALIALAVWLYLRTGR